jgi:hypothetical protein
MRLVKFWAILENFRTLLTYLRKKEFLIVSDAYCMTREGINLGH